MPLQSVTLATVRVPSMTGQGKDVPLARPPLSNMPLTSRISVALIPAQYRRFEAKVMSWQAADPGSRST
jgi:hypothetical protein